MPNYKTDYDSIRKVFWDGKIRKTQYEWGDPGIKIAIKRAFADLTARTMTRRKDVVGTENEIKNNEFHEKICEEPYLFLDKIKEWFEADHSSAEEKEGLYDVWHGEACEIVIAFLKTQYVEADATYGKAQKIVNMTMKNLFCLEGAREHDDNGKFDCCHMALDSFTLEWFWRSCGGYAGCCRESGKTDKKIYKGMIGSWSKIKNPKGKDTFTVTVEKNSGKTEKKEFYTYDFFVKAIRNYFDSSENKYNGLNAFKAEFYIWPEIQLHLAAEAVILQLNEDYHDDSEEPLSENGGKKKTDEKELKEKSIEEKLKEMKEAIDEHLKALEVNS